MNSKDISKFHTLLSTSTVSHHHHPSIWKVIVWFQKKYATVDCAGRIGQAPKKRVKKGLVRLHIRTFANSLP